jgi:hypothetical protein
MTGYDDWKLATPDYDREQEMCGDHPYEKCDPQCEGCAVCGDGCTCSDKPWKGDL